MSRIADFERTLSRYSRPQFGSWYRVDLHNHSPASFDYQYRESDVIDRLSDRILENKIAIVMFTDHGRLPDGDFVQRLSERSKKVILRGVELNVFVDAFGKPAAKIAKHLFYHLLIGFDPGGARTPDYWLEEIYHKCNEEERGSGGVRLKGIRASLDALMTVLKDSGAIIIPAHLHSTRDAFESRSIDDIFEDEQFLRDARLFTALEVRPETTARFFDGEHDETGRLEKTCVKSSDSHHPDELGRRACFVQMQEPNYSELRAALDLPFRTALDLPNEPSSYILGIHIQGQFFPDTWLTLSSHCNMLIGVKGSGKTSVLESLRYVLGSEVPVARQDTVRSHLGAILGPGGKVSALLKRSDGAKMLVERSVADDHFVVTFDDDRTEHLKEPAGLLFKADILGWHEIEQVATDPNIRRVYMDTIAGKEEVRLLKERAELMGRRIREKHAVAAERYGVFRGLDARVTRLQELRKGLQELRDANLVELRDQYQAAVDHREALNVAVTYLRSARERTREHVRGLLSGIDSATLAGSSPLQGPATEAKAVLESLVEAAEHEGESLETVMERYIAEFEDEVAAASSVFADFVSGYTRRVGELSPEKRALLETHREVLEQTKELASLEVERDRTKRETQAALHELVGLCSEVAEILDKRSEIRRRGVAGFNRELETYGVRLGVISQQQSAEFDQLRGRYSEGARVIGELRSKFPERLAHLCLMKAYGTVYQAFGREEFGWLFDHSEVGYFLSTFEDDDLRVELKAGKAGQEFSPIDQLSAGQRCTAMFPILLKLQQGPLIIDQPEDNLDNRHIAGAIAPALLKSKQGRQMVFTSHNANLVVLSDPELIVAFESDGTIGRVEERGFLATRSSAITTHVLDIVDGGERALQLRLRKYGRS